jgi:hypothetical protein
MKKILVIIFIAIVVAALGLVGYYYLFDHTVSPATGEKESFREFLPFGSNTAGSSATTTDNGEEANGGTSTPSGVPAGPLPQLQQITMSPVAGETMVDAVNASTTVVRYVDRATGNLYDFDIHTGVISRDTNTTMPKIREVVWDPSGAALIMRFLEGDTDFIQSYYAQFDPNSAEADGNRSLTGSYLPASIDSVTPLGGGKIFSLMTSTSGSSGYVSSMNGAGRTLVFQSPVREWIPQGIDQNTVALTTKASSYTNGFLYLFNIKTAKQSKIIGNVQGLTTLMSHDGKYVLFGENDNGYKLRMLNVATKAVTALPVNSIPEKCAWSDDDAVVFCAASKSPLNADFLDLWYQGMVSTSDDLWEINPIDGTSIVIADMSGKNIDGVDLVPSSDRTSVAFMNRNDLSLWIYRLNPQ